MVSTLFNKYKIFDFNIKYSPVYETRDAEEPAFQYVLDVPHVPLAVPKADALSESILLLAETLESGSAMQQFEQLYRKKPGLSADESKKQENVTKNRYRDISPCRFCTQHYSLLNY